MLPEFQSINLFSLTPGEILINLTVALACGYAISRIYRLSYRGPGYAISFVNSLILLSMITAVVMMVIGNNLARAFGLVGAMSIIRFRTAIKDAQDIIYIFLSLAIGMAAGVGYHSIAIISTLFIGPVIYLLSRSRTSIVGKREYLLQFYYASAGQEPPPYMDTLQKYCRQHRTVNIRSLGEGNQIELSFYIRLHNQTGGAELTKELGKIEGVSRVSLYYDEEPL